MILKPGLLGITCKVEEKHDKGKTAVSIDTETERQKVLDFTFANAIYHDLSRRFSSWHTIDKLARLARTKFCVISKLTSSVAIRYMVGSMEKQTDIGLKLRQASNGLRNGTSNCWNSCLGKSGATLHGALQH